MFSEAPPAVLISVALTLLISSVALCSKEQHFDTGEQKTLRPKNDQSDINYVVFLGQLSSFKRRQPHLQERLHNQV